MQRRRVIVHGRVQGVGFRWSTQDEATRRGISGWVANRDDGSVQVEIEGDEAAVDGMLDWLRHGPRAARVSGVDVTVQDPRGDAGFDVRR